MKTTSREGARRLRLRRETLRALQPLDVDDLARVAGGLDGNLTYGKTSNSCCD